MLPVLAMRASVFTVDLNDTMLSKELLVANKKHQTIPISARLYSVATLNTSKSNRRRFDKDHKSLATYIIHSAFDESDLKAVRTGVAEPSY